ncbi:hypothetical protein ANN_20989 [Periplaneta americana]|uniref:Mutator-like transposase domain-containing protein n=1 Tax=Periplaneta americana TaxID=6978 RepID=A0ABQ8SE98_PERAM|nr:hypothetical protein ANN_20989 [Periplaneta americana]
MKNYDGFSGGMESDGVVKIFKRSENLYQVRYVNYLGDGDSKGYKKVEELNVYGNVEVKKCSDGKPLTGRGRLTDSAIDQLQTYYGLAIRRNAGKDVEKMRRAVWAIYFHKYSTDEEPYHTLCPPGTDEDCWCGLNVLESLGIEVGSNTKTALYTDKKRFEDGEKFALQMTKEARTRKRNAKRRREDQETQEQDEYGAGMF